MDTQESENLPRIVFVLRACIVNSSGEILLVKRSKFDRYAPEKWEFPGGKLKINQDPYEALYEEVEQETELKIKVEQKLVYFEGHLNKDPNLYFDTPYAVIFVICSIAEKGEVDLSHEHSDFVWVNPRKALEMDIKEEDKNAINAFVNKDIISN